MNQTAALKLEERLARYKAKPTAPRRVRLVHKVNKAFGKALELRGAAKKGKLTSLYKLVDGQIPGYVIPVKAQEAIDKYAEKVSA